MTLGASDKGICTTLDLGSSTLTAFAASSKRSVARLNECNEAGDFELDIYLNNAIIIFLSPIQSRRKRGGGGLQC